MDGTFRFLKEDFLQVKKEEVSHVDVIMMNPPFSDAPRHILHAWEVAAEGCTIVALCNDESYENNTAQKWQQIREVVSANGHKIAVAGAFENAERRTDVTVTMLTMHKKTVSNDPFADYIFSNEQDIPEGGSTAGIMPYNAIRDIVQRYVKACRLFEQVNHLSKEINNIAQYREKIEGQKYEYAPYLPIIFGAQKHIDGRQSSGNVTFDEYKVELQKYYWEVIFHKLNIEKYSTAKLKQQLARFVEEQKQMPFTMRNIYSVLDIVIQTTGQRMQEALVEAFEQICEFSADNSSAGEKWKTNSDYMVNRKFIVPWMCEGQSYSWKNDTVKLSYYGDRKLDDINKALCYITGKRYEDIPDIKRFEYDKAQWGTWYEWGFFRIKFFKKGTVHCEFLDEEVWYKFNTEVARIKGWALPKNTSKTRKKA